MKYRASRRVRNGIHAATALVVAIAALGLIGYALGQLTLAGALGSFVPMVPTTAISLILLSIAIAVRVMTPRRRTAIMVLVAAVGTIVALELVDLMSGLPVAPDRLFSPATSLTEGLQLGRMSPLVAVALACVACATAMSYSQLPKTRLASQWLAIIVGNGGFILCIGYAFGAPIMEGVPAWTPALPSSFGLMLLGFSAAVLTAERGPLSLFVGDSVRAQLMRAIMPVVVGTALAFAGTDAVHHLLDIEQNPVLAASVPIVGIVAASFVTVKVAKRIGGRVDAADAAREEALVQLEAGHERLERMVRDVVLAMDHAVEVRDPFTQGHEQRVAQLARRIAQAMGMNADDAEGVEMAALLHDVGKLSVPADILSRPGKLSRVEFALVKEHAARGAEILGGIDFPWPIAEVVHQHHERLDGSGYPRGLTADAIHPYARIIAVADVVEAMASHRPYRPSVGVEAGLAEVVGHPELYDATVAAVCQRLYDAGEIVFESSRPTLKAV